MKKTAHQPTPTLESEIPYDPHRILIVDDDPAILFAYAKMLEREGFCVDSCDCIHEAIKHIKLYQYLAVVTDMRLAGTENTDGFDVIRALRKEQTHSGFILATGSANKDIEHILRQMGSTHYFEKPVDPSLILSVIHGLKTSASGDKQTFLSSHGEINTSEKQKSDLHLIN